MATGPAYDNSQLQVPAHDVDAERAVLGAMVCGRDDERIGCHHFYLAAHQLVFEAIVWLRGEGVPVDAITLTHHLRGRGQFDDVGIRTVTAVLETVPHADHIRYYADAILADYKRRCLREYASNVLRAANDPTADIDAIADGLNVGVEGRRLRTVAVLTRLAEFQPVPVKWLWPGRIARGKLTLLAGIPGLGKSLLTIDTAARVSRGWDWPDGEACDGPADVILLSAEDDPADTIRPRLDAAGADVARISLLEAVRRRDPETGESHERSLSLASDLPTIADALRERQHCRLIIIDPITAYLAGVDSHRNSDVRGLLAPLSRLAQEHDVAVLAVTHLNKSADSGRPALDRINGSGAFCAAARAVWVVGRESETSPRRIVAPAKNNLGPDSTGLAYTIAVTPEGVPVLTWDPDPVTMSADELLAPPERDPDSRGSAIADAVAWLADALQSGPVPTKDLRRQATGDGHSWTTLRRAKDALGVRATKDRNGMDGKWSWCLPDGDPDDQTESDEGAHDPPIP